MKLIHYTNEKFSLEPRKYDPYDQSKLSWQPKPNGIWVSVEGEYDWKCWCESENYELEHLAVSYEIELKEDANILHLKTSEEIFEFTKAYKNPIRNYTYEIKWDEVKAQHQGIIISPYRWDCRLSLEASWYYTWDCASGCIWDLDCIKEFKLSVREIRSYE